MSTTSVDVIVPDEERLLVQRLDQELVDRAFWKIVSAGWPSVVKTGTVLLDDASKRRQRDRGEPMAPRGAWPPEDSGRPEERSPPVTRDW